MPKKVLIFSLTYEPFIGGAEIAIKEITNRINNIEFDMITLRFDSALPSFEKIGNINVYRIGFARKNPDMKDLVRFPLKLNKLIFPILAYFKAVELNRKNKYEIIWAMMAAYAGFAAMFFKVIHPQVKYLLTLQEGDPFEFILNKVKFIRFLFNKIFTKADFIQAISNYLADWAMTMGYKGEIQVVPNAVDVEKFSFFNFQLSINETKKKLNFEVSDKILITASRLVKKNAINDVIKALKYLPSEIKFLILGIGPDEEALKQLAKDEKVEDRVRFLGQVDHRELPMYLYSADIFIRPSLSEGLGNSFLEAMAAGIPVIATPVGGITDFLFDPEKNPGVAPTGLYCQVRNPESIAEAVKKYLDNSDLKRTIVENARELVKNKYDWNIIAKQMQVIFEIITNS